MKNPKSQGTSSINRRFFELFVPIAALAILLVYSYARFFLISYAGFQFNGSTGEVSEIDVAQSTAPFLEVGDILVAVNGVSWEDIQNSQQANPLARLEPGETVSLDIHGSEGPKHIDWRASGFNMPEFWTRLVNTWPLSYAFWLAGTATLLLVRPKNERWILLIAFYYITAIWFIAGGVSSWRILESSLILRIGVWLSLPIYLHLHWNFPTLIKPVWRGWVYLLYASSAVLAMAQFIGILDPNAHALGLLIAVAISVMLLLGRFVWRPSERRDIGLLFFATAVALTPVIAVALISNQSTSDPALPGLLFSMLALPGAYFFVVYRRQLGGLEIRANRLISIYLFAVLLITLALALFPVFSASTSGLETAGGAIVITALATTLVTSLGFPPFQRFVESRLLRIPKTPEQLISEFAGEISTSISYDNLAETLKKKVLPTLLIRESALIDFEDGTESSYAVYFDGINKSALPAPADLANHVQFSMSTGENQIASLKWARLALPLRIAGSVCGLWLLGRKDPDDFYHQNEVALLSSLADQMAIALTNISQARSLRALHQADIERQEAERIHLARELHDDVLPRINELGNSSTNSGNLASKVDQLNNRVRRLMSGLRPPLLDQGLYLALEQLAEDLNAKGSTTQVNLHLPSSLMRFDPSVEQHLFRIIQQACENAIVHAQAKSIAISGKIEGVGVVLEVGDDGQGFELHSSAFSELLKTRHFGLAGMSERAAMIGAEITINSAPGKGTKVELRWTPKANLT
jgi:hypothetical protein